MSKKLALLITLVAVQPWAIAQAASPNALILNEGNAVSGGKYLGGGTSDPALGRLEGNGQNWMEFLVTKTDPGKNTLDLRGFHLDWSYNKGDGLNFGNGVMTFSQDSIWSTVPRGAMITVNEYQKAWYLINTPDFDSGNPDGDPVAGGGGMQRDGGINGFGLQTGNAYNASIDTLRDFSTNTIWNPAAVGGPDWNINVYAGQKNPSNQFQYFDFSGTVTNNGVTSNVGVDAAAGLFALNNDNWQYTLKDAANSVIQGPIGEAVAGWAAGGINSQEMLKLEAFETSQNPSLASYQNVAIGNYAEGNSSTYNAANAWNGYTNHQDLSPLHTWFGAILPGDANLDGVVSISDFATLQNKFGQVAGWQGADFNGDGHVTISDFALLQNHYGQSGGAPAFAPATVPEPAGWLLLTVGGLAYAGLSRIRSRRKGC